MVTFSKADQLKAKYEKKLKKAKEKSLPELKKEVQRLCNKYIRERDKDLTCISCNKFSDNKDSGHYIAQGSSGALRFDENNLAGQCLSCNRFKHGDLINYRYGLIARIGLLKVEELEKRRFEVKKWTREELKELKQYYKGKLNIDQA